MSIQGMTLKGYIFSFELHYSYQRMELLYHSPNVSVLFLKNPEVIAIANVSQSLDENMLNGCEVFFRMPITSPSTADGDVFLCAHMVAFIGQQGEVEPL